jgi:hypothetical protein
MAAIIISSPAKLSEMLVRLEAGGDTWHSPLIRATIAGELAYILVPPGGAVPLSYLDPTRQRLPLAVVLGGDPGIIGAGAGPDAYPQTKQLLQWARGIFLHGAGGEAWHYKAVVNATLDTRRLLLVETDSAQLHDWIAAKERIAPRTRGLIWRVEPGDVHPSCLPAGAVWQ